MEGNSCHKGNPRDSPTEPHSGCCVIRESPVSDISNLSAPSSFKGIDILVCHHWNRRDAFAATNVFSRQLYLKTKSIKYYEGVDANLNSLHWCIVSPPPLCRDLCRDVDCLVNTDHRIHWSVLFLAVVIRLKELKVIEAFESIHITLCLKEGKYHAWSYEMQWRIQDFP